MRLTESWHAGDVDKKIYDWKFKPGQLKHVKKDKDGSETRIYKLSKKELEKYLKNIDSREVPRRK